ncbi:I78 family peptidase inhibitor [Streptomyces sp. NPDC006990]|uniref:I78 family peptidase inhibitor n=1 Tax=unclassified Streptomyces TaxID=2593676 RepID=UPI0034563787
MAPESAAPQPSDGTPQDAPEDYVGLGAQEAEQRARARGWSSVRRLEPDAIITMEYVVGRLNLAVEDDRVVRCWAG